MTFKVKEATEMSKTSTNNSFSTDSNKEVKTCACVVTVTAATGLCVHRCFCALSAVWAPTLVSLQNHAPADCLRWGRATAGKIHWRSWFMTSLLKPIFHVQDKWCASRALHCAGLMECVCRQTGFSKDGTRFLGKGPQSLSCPSFFPYKWRFKWMWAAHPHVPQTGCYI